MAGGAPAVRPGPGPSAAGAPVAPAPSVCLVSPLTATLQAGVFSCLHDHQQPQIGLPAFRVFSCQPSLPFHNCSVLSKSWMKSSFCVLESPVASCCYHAWPVSWQVSALVPHCAFPLQAHISPRTASCPPPSANEHRCPPPRLLIASSSAMALLPWTEFPRFSSVQLSRSAVPNSATP